MLSSCESYGVKSRASCAHTIHRSFISSSLLKFTIALFLLALYIGQFNIVPQVFQHLNESLIDDILALLYQPIHIGRSGSHVLGKFRLRGFCFYALYLYIALNIILKH